MSIESNKEGSSKTFWCKLNGLKGYEILSDYTYKNGVWTFNMYFDQIRKINSNGK